MQPEPLIGIYAKIERAETHIQDLVRQFNAYILSNPYELVTEINAERTEQVWRFKLVRHMPTAISTIAGDATRNLRTSLDNLVSAIAVKNGKTFAGTSFPFGGTVEEFECALSDKTKKLPPAAREMIRALKPYKGGNDLLWLLHRADLRDKHFVPMRVSLTNALQVSQIVVTNGRVMILGPRNGQNLAVAGYIPAERWSGQEEDIEVITTTPGAQLQTDFKPTFDIAIGDVEGFEGESVITALYQMREAVERIVRDFDRIFFQ